MRTMKALKVYEWLLDNLMFIAAPAFVNQFGLTGEVTHEQIQEFLANYLGERSSRAFREMQCRVTTFLYLEQA
jgi:hypothetical protein